MGWSMDLVHWGGPWTPVHVLYTSRFDSDAYANLHRVHVTNEVKANKSKALKFFENAGVKSLLTGANC